MCMSPLPLWFVASGSIGASRDVNRLHVWLQADIKHMQLPFREVTCTVHSPLHSYWTVLKWSPTVYCFWPNFWHCCSLFFLVTNLFCQLPVMFCQLFGGSPNFFHVILLNILVPDRGSSAARYSLHLSCVFSLPYRSFLHPVMFALRSARGYRKAAYCWRLFDHRFTSSVTDMSKTAQRSEKVN